MVTRIDETPATYISTPVCPACGREYPTDVVCVNTRSSQYRITRHFRCEHCHNEWHKTSHR